MRNILKEKLKENKSIIGPFMKLPSPAVVEIIGTAGFDYAIIDCEHGPLDMLKAEEMIRSAHLSNLGAVIRVSENNPVLISRALDIGADAVQIPQISCKEEAVEAVKAAKFQPLGERGVCRYVRAAGYSSVVKSEYFSSANEDTMVILQVEGLEGINNIDDILEVEGVDIIFIGPYDLSQSLGCTGDVENPLVVNKMKEVVEKAKAKNKIIGTFVDDIKTAHKYTKEGLQYISYSVDVGIIYNKFKNDLTEYRQG